jgi:hypothetical protein
MRGKTPDTWEGLGVPRDQIERGMRVIVAMGTINALVNGEPALICMATVMGPGSSEGRWWLDVEYGPNATMPQEYHANEILGVPSLGLLAGRE